MRVLYMIMETVVTRGYWVSCHI